MLSKQISINDSLYKITVGKYDRNFTIINNDFTQIVKVSIGKNSKFTNYFCVIYIIK